MKNLYLLPTDKPSRLIHNDSNQLCYQSNKSFKNDRKWMYRKKFNIYITSDEDIKEGDWYLVVGGIGLETNTLHKSNGDTPKNDWLKKIILTTDEDLINCFCKCCGVQPISDEFLEWFVKNPSCEEIEVENSGPGFPAGIYFINYLPEHFVQEATIPKEDPKYTLSNLDNDKYKDFSVLKEDLRKYPLTHDECFKKETLEEAAERIAYDSTEENKGFPSIKRFIEGAKWQQKRMYSEEDMVKFISFVSKNYTKAKGFYHMKGDFEKKHKVSIYQILEQFKKQ